MVYVRQKTIKGNTYNYAQHSVRENGKVTTKHVLYLGKNGEYQPTGNNELLGTTSKLDELSQERKELLEDNKAEIINNDVIVYHLTNKQNKEQILKDKKMFAKEDGIFFTTKKDGQAKGFGDSIIKLKIPINKLKEDDVFGNEVHLKISNKNKSIIKY